MKQKIRAFAGGVSVVAMSLPALAMAQFQKPSGTQLPEGSVSGIIKNAMNWLLMIVGFIGVIGFAIAGILYLTAAGEESRIDTAKSAMVYSIVGVVVAILGLVVIRAAESLLGGSSTSF